MKQFIVTLSLLLCCFATAGAKGQSFPQGINNVEFVVPTFPNVVGVADALQNALKKTTGLDDDNVHVVEMDYSGFVDALEAVHKPQSGTLRIPLFSVDPARPLPDYATKLKLLGSVAEEPMAIWEARRGFLNEKINEVMAGGKDLKVGVLDSGSALVARAYFGSQDIPIGLSYVDNYATSIGLLQNDDIQAFVGPFMKDNRVKVAYRVESLAAGLPLKIPTGYGYLAFTPQNLEDSTAAALADILKDAAEEQSYREMLDVFGLQGGYTGGDTYLQRMLQIASAKCKTCKYGNFCDTDQDCIDSCDNCKC